MDAGGQRLIEHGFPCHQVGAETQRERGMYGLPASLAVHIWWARRPLIPSRAAIAASLNCADTDPETFIRQLGIERVQALVNGAPWTTTREIVTSVLSVMLAVGRCWPWIANSSCA